MPITVTPTQEIPDVLIIEPKVFGDSRGWFYESFNQKEFTEKTGVTEAFIQDNHSFSTQHILRGLHYQIEHPQGKLVRVTGGKVLDVAVDIRESSPTFGQWTAIELSAENHKQLWVPPGCAHGFFVLSPSAHFLYKVTNYWDPSSEQRIIWNDPTLDINWQLPQGVTPSLNPKDAQGKTWEEAIKFA
jgi:dTDP-4-dehydrorhamnose 3,5-epimerase